MIAKLRLPFALLSDPGGDRLLKVVGAWNPDARGGIGRPAAFVVDPDGRERFRQRGRDFADRISEDDLLAEAKALGLPATTQPPLTMVLPQPGDDAMPLHALLPYCRGAKFAAKAMGMRHPQASEESHRYVAQMERYMAAIRAWREAIGT